MTKKKHIRNNVSEEKKEEREKIKSLNFSVCSNCSIIFCLVTILASYYIYYICFDIPPLPDLDLNYWWGPNPVDINSNKPIRRVKITFSEEMIEDLKQKLSYRRPFVAPLEGAAFTYGFNTTYLDKLLDFWHDNYDFREREDFLNKFNHFVTEIQGLGIHFIHVKPNVTDDVRVVPLLMLHGWPSSVREFYEIIPTLTIPRSTCKFVFEVIATSLPGYGFSQAPVRPGLGAAEVAVIMRNLMLRLGHTQFYVHGTNLGSLISSNMATLFPQNVLGYHTSTPLFLKQPLAAIYTLFGSWWQILVADQELKERMYPVSWQLRWILEEFGYLHLQATKPDTIGIALTDSPAGLAAYVLEKFSIWTNPANVMAEDGNLIAKFSLTHLLDNVMIYWSTYSITTSMRLYKETINERTLEMKLDKIPTEVPTRCIVPKYGQFILPEIIIKLKYRNYMGHTISDKGGYFATFERPTIIADDIFNSVKHFISFHKKNR